MENRDEKMSKQITLGQAIGFTISILVIVIGQWVGLMLTVNTNKVESDGRWNQIEYINKENSEFRKEIKDDINAINNNITTIRISIGDKTSKPNSNFIGD